MGINSFLTNKNLFSTELRNKLEGIEEEATKNDADFNLKNRENHLGSQSIDTITNLQNELDNKKNKILAKEYVDSSIDDIKSIIDNWGSPTVYTGYNYDLHGNYSGDDVVIDNYYNISFTGTNNPTGSPHTVFENRSLTLQGSDCTRIKIININIKNGLIVNGTQGRHYFEKCNFGGFSISSTTNWVTFTDCSFDDSVIINNNFTGSIYFIRCSFSGQQITLNNLSPLQIVFSDCSGFANIPSNAFKSGMISLLSGIQSLYVNNNPISLEDFNSQIASLEENKVDKVAGKDLSSNDFTDSLKSKLDNLGYTSDIEAQLEFKVDKILDADGNEIKHLSTNDFTDEEKQKIEQNRLDILDKVDKQSGYQLTQEDFTSVLRALLVNIGDVAANSIKIGDENGIGNNITFNQFKEDFEINNKVDKVLDTNGNEIKQLSTNDFTDAYKNHIDNLLAIVNTNNEDLDTFSEIIAYIQANKSELDSLSISSIIGLEDALNLKSDESNNYIKTLDNRNVSSLPSANLGKLSLEFKSGVNANLNTNYAGLLTITPYTDTSAGTLAHQFGFNENGLFYRKSNSDHTAWGDWQGFVYSSSDGSLNLEADLNFENGRVINAKNSSGQTQTFLWPRWTDDVTYLNYGQNGFNIRNNSSASSIFITNSGNVGINNPNPQHRLDVNGNIALPYGSGINVNNSNFGSKKILETKWNGSYDVTELYSPGASFPQRNFTMAIADQRVGIAANPSASYTLLVGGWVGAGSFNTTSDEKIKENVKDIDICFIDKLSKIELKSYNLIDDKKKDVQFGVIAQQLEKIGLEQLVTTAQHSQDFGTKKEAEKFIAEKPHLEAKIEKFTVKKQKQVFVFNGKEFEKIEDAIKEEGDLKGRPSQIDSKFIDYEIYRFKCVWNQKSVNYNNLFVLQQALINDQQSILRTQGLSFLISDIKEVYFDKFLNKYEVLTQDGDLIKSIEKNGNTQNKRIDAWIAQGNKVTNKIYSKQEILNILKEENNKRIRTFNNKVHSKQDWLQKSQNYQDVINRFTSQLVIKSQGGKFLGKEITQEEYNSAVSMIERKDKYVEHYHKILKPLVEEAYKNKSLNIFNPYSETPWLEIDNNIKKLENKGKKGLFSNILNKLFSKD